MVRTVTSKPRAFGTLKLLAIAGVLFVTNDGIGAHMQLLIDQDRLSTLVMFAAVWLLCLGCLLIAAFQPRWPVRALWAFLFSLSSGAAYGYQLASGTQLTVYDLLSLWNSRQEAGRAYEFYFNDVVVGLLVVAVGFVAFMATPPIQRASFRKALSRLSWAPAVPVAVITAIVFLRAGGGTHALPQQFTPVAMTMLLAAKTATWEPAVRREVRVDPVARPSARHIVLLVDESVRGDYLDFTPGNPYTPNLPGLRDRVADFGLASSGGNCSQYSNVILRLGGARNDLIHTMRTNPFIWQYARKAGFRTMYIDAQAPEDKNTGRLQNYMTVEEVKWIDEFVVIQNTSSPTLDFKALEMVGEKLKGDTPYFIYVNKNGAHFPYDKTYPADAVRFRPTMSEADGGNTMAARINSYRNAVSWSVDGFLRKLFEIDLSHSAVFYTSDHGQQFDPARLTHCNVSDADPREGLVPLLLISGDPDLKSRFAEAAGINYDRASHFAIFPTVLQVMGYPLGFVRETFGEDLLSQINTRQAFTSGDVFGLFADVNWNPVDVHARYLEEAFTAESVQCRPKM
jgi:glucan phosphoethanolaminetransferase (alkaline phosphatase superfamily)